MKKLLVTAALPYSNGRPHVGHLAGCYLPADIFVRYKRMCGVDVKYVCGSDDHGVAIVLSAEKEGKTPQEIASFYHDIQLENFKDFGISFDVYGATSTTESHKALSQEFFLKLFEKGFMEKNTTKQFYDESKEMFLPDRYVKGTCGYCDAAEQNGDQCENCGKVLDPDHMTDVVSVVSCKPASVKETTHWFLDLSRFESDVKEWIENADLRDHTRNFVSGLLGAGLVKRSMTRDTSWGIPLPIDDPEAEGKVLYVWFDAPIGYISNTLQMLKEEGKDPEEYSSWWKSDDSEVVHFIGEDNTIFHCVIWIAMLKAEGSYTLPKGVVVNNFLNFQSPGEKEEKMSKSRGTAIWLADYLEQGGNPDSLRYYLTAIAPERARTPYQPDALLQRNNTDLANVIGNFVNRIVSFTKKYVGEEAPTYTDEQLSDLDKEFLSTFATVKEKTATHLDAYQFKQALETVMEFARSCNKYVDEKAPWVTRKDDMDTTRVTLAVSLHAISFLSALLAPFLPFTSEKMRSILNLEPCSDWSGADRALPEGLQLGETVILFEKMEAEKWLPQDGVDGA